MATKRREEVRETLSQDIRHGSTEEPNGKVERTAGRSRSAYKLTRSRRDDVPLPLPSSSAFLLTVVEAEREPWTGSEA